VQLPHIDCPWAVQAYPSASFDEHGRAEAINPYCRKGARRCNENPGVRLDALVRTTYLGERDAEDAVADLMSRSYLVRDTGRALALTPEGRRLRKAVRKRWEEFQQPQQVAGISEADLSCAQRGLTILILFGHRVRHVAVGQNLRPAAR
jgi:hypothetical protein